jgi:hypothetical protein
MTDTQRAKQGLVPARTVRATPAPSARSQPASALKRSAPTPTPFGASQLKKAKLPSTIKPRIVSQPARPVTTSMKMDHIRQASSPTPSNIPPRQGLFIRPPAVAPSAIPSKMKRQSFKPRPSVMPSMAMKQQFDMMEEDLMEEGEEVI